MMRRLVTGLFALVGVVALTGCNVASRIVVHPDGSGTYAVTMTAPDGAGDPGKALFQSVAAAAAKSTVPLDVTHYSAGGESGAKISFTFRSMTDLQAENARLAALGNGLGGLSITRDTSGWHFSATSTTGLVAPSAAAASGSSRGIIDGAALAQTVDVSVVLEMPGAPGENDATATTHTSKATTFTWALPVGRKATPLQASTTFTGAVSLASVPLATALTPVAGDPQHRARGGSDAVSIIAAAIAAAVVLGGGAFAVWHRRRRPQTAAA